MARYFLRFRHSDTGFTPTFVYFKNASTLAAVGSPPAINELGTGTYYFDYSPSFDIVYEVDGDASIVDVTIRYIADTISPRDTYLDEPTSQVVTDVWNDNTTYAAGKKGKRVDDIQRIKVVSEGRWKIFTGGGDANRLVLYDTDGTTVLQKWDLKDSAGAASTTNVFERVPVNVIP